jgi:hypothetical protein
VLFLSLSDHLQYKLLFSPILHAEKAAPRVEAIFEASGNGDAAAMERPIAHHARDSQSKR